MASLQALARAALNSSAFHDVKIIMWNSELQPWAIAFMTPHAKVNQTNCSEVRLVVRPDSMLLPSPRWFLDEKLPPGKIAAGRAPCGFCPHHGPHVDGSNGAVKIAPTQFGVFIKAELKPSLSCLYGAFFGDHRTKGAVFVPWKSLGHLDPELCGRAVNYPKADQ